MTKEDKILLEELSENIRWLMNRVSTANDRYQAVADEKHKLEEKIVLLEEENRKLRKQYESAKIANSLTGSTPDNEFTKRRINKLVREIDQCIALLNQ